MSGLMRLRSARGHVRSSADRSVRWMLARRGVTDRALLPRLFGFLARRAPDPAATGRAAIDALSSTQPLTVTDLAAQYIRGLVPFGVYECGERYYWDRPSPRGLITSASARLSKSIRRQIKSAPYEVRFDTDVERIIRSCQRGAGTWLQEPIVRLYLEAAEVGLCTTIGAYADGELVGGEFGLDLAGWYASMSTFYTAAGAGNVLLARVVEEIKTGGRFAACDTGLWKDHSRQFGAVAVDDAQFTAHLLQHLGRGGEPGSGASRPPVAGSAESGGLRTDHPTEER